MSMSLEAMLQEAANKGTQGDFMQLHELHGLKHPRVAGA